MVFLSASLLAAKTFFRKLDIRIILVVCALLAVLITGVIIYQSGVNAEKNANQIESLQVDLTQLNTNFDAYKSNVVTVDDIQSLQSTTVRTQYEVRERIRNVPVIAEDRPFIVDPGLLDRVDIMRTHQESYSSAE